MLERQQHHTTVRFSEVKSFQPRFTSLEAGWQAVSSWGLCSKPSFN